MNSKSTDRLEKLAFPIIFMRAFFKHGIQRMASQLAFSGLFALVPLLALAFQITLYIPGLGHNNQDWQQHFIERLMPEGLEYLSVYVLQWLNEVKRFSLVGFSIYAVSSVMLIITLARFINEIWGVPIQKRRVFGIWSMLIVFPAGLAVLGFLMTLVTSMDYLKALGFSDLPNLPFEVVVPIVSCVLLWTIQVLLTSYPVPLRQAVYVSVLQTLILGISAKAFMSVISFFPSMQVMTGITTALPLIMMWMYWIALVVLSGTLMLKMVAKGDFCDSV